MVIVTLARHSNYCIKATRESHKWKGRWCSGYLMHCLVYHHVPGPLARDSLNCLTVPIRRCQGSRELQEVHWRKRCNAWQQHCTGLICGLSTVYNHTHTCCAHSLDPDPIFCLGLQWAAWQSKSNRYSAIRMVAAKLYPCKDKGRAWKD